MSKPHMILWLSDARGQYIPRDFAQSFADRAKHVTGVQDWDWAILENPEDECYWDAWNNVLNNATVTDDKGIKYTLHQDGDLWLVPEGMEWSDKDETFIWPEEENTNADQ